jgi:hypothetical protein
MNDFLISSSWLKYSSSITVLIDRIISHLALSILFLKSSFLSNPSKASEISRSTCARSAYLGPLALIADWTISFPSNLNHRET